MRKSAAPPHTISSPASAGSTGPLGFDTLDFFDAALSEPIVAEQSMTVVAHGLNRVVPGSTPEPLPTVRLVLFGVALSHREIHPYLGSPAVGRFADTILVHDVIPRSESGPALNSYHLEGLLEHPLAWVTWTVAATSVHIEPAA